MKTRKNDSNFCPYVLCIIPTVIITHKERVMLLKILSETTLATSNTILITTIAMHVFRTVFPHIYVRTKVNQTITQNKKNTKESQSKAEKIERPKRRRRKIRTIK